MRFSEMPYARPDLAAVKQQFADLLARFKAAATYAEAHAVFLEEEKLNKHVDTLAQLASVRNTIDTRDKFYDEEMNFWNEATPQLQECQNAWSRAMLDSPFRADFTAEYGDLMFVNAEIADKAFSPDILDEMAQENKLTTEYGKLIASAQIPFEGGVYTLSQLSPFKNDPDDARRLAAWKAEGAWYKEHRPSLTASTTSSSTCVTPWAKSSAMRATPRWATTAWAATATRRPMWKSSAPPSSSTSCRWPTASTASRPDGWASSTR